MHLSDRRTLGRSGLPVSPLCLGAMTFANPAWGSPDDISTAVFNAFVDAGGNFLDTADVYSGGRSEELLGRLIAARGLRDQLVLATKSGFKGGSGRKNLSRAVDASLHRLGTDFIDLYWIHVWDRVTPAEELLQSLGDLVRSGKIRYFGLSDVPAWYATRMATLAQAYNVPGPIALQLPYALTERTIENEHVPAARALGLGITPWSSLGAGFLTGKYSRDQFGNATAAGGRLDHTDQPFRMFTERNWKILDTLRAVSAEAGCAMAQVALAWVSAQPGVTSLILGANQVEQLEDNLAALTLSLSPEHLATLNQASSPDTGPGSFYSIFSDAISRGIFGASVEGWQ